MTFKKWTIPALILLTFLAVSFGGCATSSSTTPARSAASTTQPASTSSVTRTIPEETPVTVSQVNITFYDASYDGREITVNTGDSFKVQLESNASTGYSWALVSISDDTVLENTGNVYDTPLAKVKEGSPPLVGAPGMEFWTFKALATGTSIISMEYRRPWEKDAEPAKTFSLTVNVK